MDYVRPAARRRDPHFGEDPTRCYYSRGSYYTQAHAVLHGRRWKVLFSSRWVDLGEGPSEHEAGKWLEDEIRTLIFIVWGSAPKSLRVDVSVRAIDAATPLPHARPLEAYLGARPSWCRASA